MDNYERLLDGFKKYGRAVRIARAANDPELWVDSGYFWCIVRSRWNTLLQGTGRAIIR